MFSPASAAITQVASLPLDPLETRPVKLVLTHDDSSVFPVDDEDYDVFFDDLQIEQAPSLSHLAFGLTDGVHFISTPCSREERSKYSIPKFHRRS